MLVKEREDHLKRVHLFTKKPAKESEKEYKIMKVGDLVRKDVS